MDQHVLEQVHHAGSGGHLRLQGICIGIAGSFIGMRGHMQCDDNGEGAMAASSTQAYSVVDSDDGERGYDDD